MNIRISIGLLLLFLVDFTYGQVQNVNAQLAPIQNRKHENYQLSKYKYSLEELKNNFSKEMMQLAKKQYEKVQETNNKGNRNL
jgi:hypothetical protein